MRLRLPWLPFALIDELRLAVGEESNVFEFGGGGSTLWFLDRGAHVVTVEHHQGWAEQLSRAVRSAKWTLLTRELTPNADRYVESVAAYPDASFDVIVVDGRERARCALAALGKVRHGGMLIFDDVDRERYAAALDAITWPRKDYIGFAPAKPSLAYTAVFTRPLSG